MTTRDQDETHINNDSAVSQALSTLGGNANPQARRRAAEALGSPSQSIRDNRQRVVEVLTDTVLSDPNDDVRAEAINSLYFQGDEYIQDLVTEIADTTRSDAGTVRETFSRWLTHSHSEFRMVGATAMSTFADAVTPELESALTDDDPRVQARAARAYGTLNADSVEPIRPLLQAPNAHVRQAAVSALTNIGTPNALEMLSTLVRTSDEQLRRIAAKHLYRLDREQSARLLFSSLRDRSARVQRTAMVSLIRLFAEGQSVTSAEVSTYLLTTDSFDHDVLAESLHAIVSEDREDHVTVDTQRYAIWLLGELTERVDDSMVLPWLIDALDHPDRLVADTAAAYLPLLDAPTLEKELRMLVSDADTAAEAAERAQRVLDKLRQSTAEAVEKRAIEYTFLRYPSDYTRKYSS